MSIFQTEEVDFILGNLLIKNVEFNTPDSPNSNSELRKIAAIGLLIFQAWLKTICLLNY